MGKKTCCAGSISKSYLLSASCSRTPTELPRSLPTDSNLEKEILFYEVGYALKSGAGNLSKRACIFNTDLIYCSYFSGNITDFQYTGVIGGPGYALPTLHFNKNHKMKFKISFFYRLYRLLFKSSAKVQCSHD